MLGESRLGNLAPNIPSLKQQQRGLNAEAQKTTMSRDKTGRVPPGQLGEAKQFREGTGVPHGCVVIRCGTTIVQPGAFIPGKKQRCCLIFFWGRTLTLSHGTISCELRLARRCH